jgi:peptide-methionine (S)-S-oxide reductase
MLFGRHKTAMVEPDRALHGRDHYDFAIPATHFVNGHPLQPPFPDGFKTAVFGLGCFWGAEEIYWKQPGVWTTAVGYTGGYTGHPSYEEVCSGLTGHTEAVLAVYDPAVITFERLVAIFFEVHDPTQGMRQGNDVGTQYRSGIYYADDEQKALAERAVTAFGSKLARLGYDPITTEVAAQGQFYYAEGYHQQYLAKHPDGYRCHSTTGVSFPADAFSA